MFRERGVAAVVVGSSLCDHRPGPGSGVFGCDSRVESNSLIVVMRIYMNMRSIAATFSDKANDISHARPLFDRIEVTFRELLRQTMLCAPLAGGRWMIDRERNCAETPQKPEIQQSSRRRRRNPQ